MTERDRLREGATPTFIPKRKEKPTKQHILTEFTPEQYIRVKAAAKRSGVSMKDFAKQGVLFALEHLDKTVVE